MLDVLLDVHLGRSVRKYQFCQLIACGRTTFVFQIWRMSGAPVFLVYDAICWPSLRLQFCFIRASKQLGEVVGSCR